jgi:hypothetical protein
MRAMQGGKVMKNVVRRIAAGAASAAVAGGVFLAAGGTASAAAVPAEGHTFARATTAVDVKAYASDHGRGDRGGEWDGCRYDDRESRDFPDYGSQHWNADDRTAYDRFCPWVYDQLVPFGYYADHGHRRVAEG